MWLFTVDFLIYWAIIERTTPSSLPSVERTGVSTVQLRASLVKLDFRLCECNLTRTFFHTLNAVSVLAMKGEERAVVAMLPGSATSFVSRSTIASRRSSTREGLEFIDGYLEIQRLRFRDRFTVDRDIAEGTLSFGATADPTTIVKTPSCTESPLILERGESSYGGQSRWDSSVEYQG